jgi:putative CocE/NonD family hydrolase
MTGKEPREMRVDWNTRVPMRDGTLLSADVFRSGNGEPRTTLVARTPYNKNNGEHQARAEAYVADGYNFVWMDVRGRGDSDGEFRPWRAEGRDGYDTIEWIAAQDWSDGDVVTWGASYLGCIQWMTALEQPPHLRGMIVYVSPSDPFEDNASGIAIPWEICWMRMLDGHTQQHVERIDWPSLFWHLPYLTMDTNAGFRSEHWRDFVTHPVTANEHWDPIRFQPRITEVTVPVLAITGWYDDVQRGTIQNFTLLTAPDAPAEVSANQWMIVGPWDHGCTTTRNRKLGPVDFGPGAETDLPALEREWLAAVLRKEAAPPAPVRLFVMGTNTWREEQEWPLARTRWSRYFLASAGDANSRHGGGQLRREEEPGDGSPPDTYRYDPADPVPFISNHASSSQIGGPDDYAEVEERPDVLVYSTAPLAEALEVTGPVQLKLYASSSAVDTDFTAKLLDVHPDGFCQRLCDGMVRARFRNGHRQPETRLTPGEVTEFGIDLWSTSHVFAPGHRIRLEVSSSAFPKYDRNLNTGGPLDTGTEMVTATNSVWHSRGFASHLVLPEIPGHS